MAHKIDDEDAFAYYASLGLERSLAKVATKYGITKRAAAMASSRGCWTARLEKIEQQAKRQFDKKLSETLSEVRERHLKMCRAVQSRGIQAIQSHPLEDAMQGAKALDMAIKLERVILGEPDSRASVSVEELTRREVESFLEPDVDSATEDDDDGDAD